MNNKNIVKYIKLPRALMFLLSFTTLYICPFLRTLFSPEALAEPHLHYSAKNNLNRNLTTVGSVTTIYSMFKSLTYTVCAQKPDICRCIYPRRDRLGFYAEIQFIFGPLYSTLPLICLLTLYVNTSHLFLGSLCPSSIVHYLYPSSMPLPSFFLLLILGFSMSLFRLLLSPLILCVPILSPLILCVPTSLPFLRPDSLSLPFSSDSLCPYLTLLSPLILCVPIPPTISKTHPVWLLLNRGPLVYIKAPDCRRWMG